MEFGHQLIVCWPGDEEFKVGEHFKAGEFRPKKRWFAPNARRGPWFISPDLVKVLDIIRDDIGMPLRLVNGYRPPQYNKRVGGASESRHMVGDAADLSAACGPIQIARAAFRIRDAHRVSIGFSRKRVHVDTRPKSIVLYGYDELKSADDDRLIGVLEQST